MSEKVGVVIGRGKEKDQLEIVVAFQEREKISEARRISNYRGNRIYEEKAISKG